MRLRVASGGNTVAAESLSKDIKRRAVSPYINCKRVAYCFGVIVTINYLIFYRARTTRHRETNFHSRSFSNHTISISNRNGLNIVKNEQNEIPPVCVAGIVRDVSSIQFTMWRSLFEMNCVNQYTVHMVAGGSIESTKEYKKKLWQEWRIEGEYAAMELTCAPFFIVNESKEYTDTGTNSRVDKISFLRDNQREMLRKYFENKLSNTAIVILVDFDLFLLPKTEQLVHIVNQLRNPNYQHDAVCASGVTIGNFRRKSKSDQFYYDTFSTVLLPNTWVHPLSRRLFANFFPGEDPKLVRSNNQFGKFTQADLMRYFVKEGKQSTTGQVSVRSCFGGLTVYKALQYLSGDCHYFLPRDVVIHGNASSIMKYASLKDNRPCEHVVMHECLKTSHHRFDIALDPHFVTQWRKDS